MPIIAGDMGLYFAIMLLTLVIGAGAQIYVTSQLKKYSHVPSAFGITGAEMARRMSIDKGISNVDIYRGGPNQDFFDPRSNAVTLGTDSYGQYSITAVATAVHEMGHAQQFAEGYAFMKFRSALVPVVNFCSNAWVIIFMLGLFMGAAGGTFMKLGIIMFAAVLLFQLVTLPVELPRVVRIYCKRPSKPAFELFERTDFDFMIHLATSKELSHSCTYWMPSMLRSP